MRESVLERTFGLYLRHVPYWIGLLLPALITAAAVFLALRWAIGDTGGTGVPEARARAAAAIPFVAAGVWLLATGVGTQTLALAGHERDGRLPRIDQAWMRFLPRLSGTLAVTMLVAVSVGALGLAGVGLGAGLAWLPLDLLPRLGATPGTARSVALVVLLPLLVAGCVPALWCLGRHAVAIALQTLDGGSPWATFNQARALTRGHTMSLLGLLIVTALANQALVLLARAAGSLLTLLVAPGRFRPIFGEGPLRQAAGLEVQLGATLLATLIALPLVLLSIPTVAAGLRESARPRGEP